jgi:hypothetical protein
MGFKMIPMKWRPNTPGWRPCYKPETVAVTTVQDNALGRTSGWMVSARSSGGGSIAVDFDWPQVWITLSGSGGMGMGAYHPTVLMFSTWVRTRPGQRLSGTLAFWDLTKEWKDSVPFEATDRWSPLSLSAGYPDTFRDKHRLEIYMHTPNVDLLVDRTAAS